MPLDPAFATRKRQLQLTRKFINHRNEFVSEHDNSRRKYIQNLVRDKGHPRLNNQILVVKRNQCHDSRSIDQIR